MRPLQGLSYEEVAFEVCSAFDRAGTLVVLPGGGAAAVHAPEAHETRDLDFALQNDLFGATDAAPLRELGFVPTRTGGTYAHPDTPYTLEIIPGPLGVGDGTLTAWETRRKRGLVLHLLSPIDSIKDRLGAAIHFRDLNSARQAAEIAKLHPVDLDAVRSWCEGEGGSRTFAILDAFRLG